MSPKKEAGIPTEVELTSHTGRRAWATYQAENGVPLPLLSKMLGHKQLETTAQYYWRNVYYSVNEISESNEVGAKNKTGGAENQILYGQKLTAKMDILNSVKDKKYWQEYNARRKKYLSRKNKERYLKAKKRVVNTTALTTYACQELAKSTPLMALP